MHADQALALPRRKVIRAMVVLVALIFSKYFYLASMAGYYTFYLISRFHVSVRSSQLHLFVFLGRGGGGNLSGRADRRPHRAEICDLGLDSRRACLYADAARANLFWTGH